MTDHPGDPGDSAPRYNVRAVARLVGLAPVTLRAWERRYGLPAPRRGAQGYRLYSDYDVRTLRWLKDQTDRGLSISRAALHLSELRSGGRDPAATPLVNATAEAAGTERLAARVLTAFGGLDDEGAAEVLRLAFALYPVDEVLLDIVQPALRALGERWHRGELPVAVEHFATQFCLRHLMTLHAAAGAPTRPGVMVAAGAPGEFHQIGLLMLVVRLRWRGWDVKYLGPDLSLEGLAEAIAPLRPRLLLFTATRPESAAALAALPDVLAQFPPPPPRVVVGGQAFEGASLNLGLVDVCLMTGPAGEAVEVVEGLMQSGHSAVRPDEASHPEGHLAPAGDEDGD